MKERRITILFAISWLSLLILGEPVEIKIGVLAPFSREDDLELTSEAGYQMVSLALEEAEKSILPDVRFTVTRLDTYSGKPDPETDGATSILEALEAIKNDTVAFVGDIRSIATTQSALFTGMFQVPQCSYISGAHSLSNKEVYPYFFRTLPGPKQTIAAVIDFVKRQGWSRLGVVYTDDPLGRNSYDLALSFIRNTSIQIVSNAGISLDEKVNSTNIQTKILEFEKFDVKIVLLLGSPESTYFYITAWSMGKLVGPNYLYLLDNDPNFIAENLPDNLDEISGNFLLFNIYNDPLYADPFMPLWENATLRYPDRYPLLDPVNSIYNVSILNAPAAYACGSMIAAGLEKLVSNLLLQAGNGTTAKSILKDISKGMYRDHMKPSLFSKFSLPTCIC